MTFQQLIGKAAPPITLPNYDGETYAWKAGVSGLPTALFFYPQSGSYGCTREACQFRDAIAEKDIFGTDKVQIIGISIDAVEKQKVFVERQKLTYPVLSDVHKETVTAYGVGSGMMGLVGVARVTFIVDKKGIVRDAIEATMNYGAHSKFVEKWLEKFAEEDKEAAAAQPPTATTTAAEPQPAAATDTYEVERCKGG
ncbi:thioredoxin-like protein [Crepidotus variabilis]|uniref:thioredoxin-dependent peroxiredoxin n=1 Tax=Crepidotus variabilis TaxID=179855 RepID=A0A9P6JUB3_9AGAR|nr:thioredoxin-like protein [Crepidotus variabilis]